MKGLEHEIHGDAKGADIVHPREEKDQGHLIHVYKYLVGMKLRMWRQVPTEQEASAKIEIVSMFTYIEEQI